MNYGFYVNGIKTLGRLDISLKRKHVLASILLKGWDESSTHIQ